MASSSSDERHMNSAQFGHARSGDTAGFDQSDLDKILTRQRNTVLHVYITASTTDETEFVERILDLCPALLLKANTSNEIPLHLAARYGLRRIVKILIDRAKAMAGQRGEDIESGGRQTAREMLRMTTGERDTPLHEAVRFGHVRVADVLMTEDPDYVFPANKVGERPLYMAAERGNLDLVRSILTKCASPLAIGPNNRTALHAAIIGNHRAIAEAILEKMANLAEQTDENGWLPLHYSADMNHMTITEILLSFNKYALYIGDSKGKTPLHIAASHGHVKIMKRMYEECPDCYELVDNTGRNALHYAVQSNDLGAVKFILKDSSLSYLLNGKDDNGNTPFHLIANSCIAKTFLSNSRVDTLAFNNQNKNSLDLADSNVGYGNGFTPKCLKRRLTKGGLPSRSRITTGRDKKDKESTGKRDAVAPKIDKARETSLITGTLIATVTFAAGFAIPGSYVSENGTDPGTAILKKSIAFQIFIVVNTIAFILSTNAVLRHLFMPFWEKRVLVDSITTSNRYISLAMAAMVLAFVSATYAVLQIQLALIVTFISFIFFFLRFFIFSDASTYSEICIFY